MTFKEAANLTAVIIVVLVALGFLLYGIFGWTGTVKQ